MLSLKHLLVCFYLKLDSGSSVRSVVCVFVGGIISRTMALTIHPDNCCFCFYWFFCGFFVSFFMLRFAIGLFSSFLSLPYLVFFFYVKP